MPFGDGEWVYNGWCQRGKYEEINPPAKEEDKPEDEPEKVDEQDKEPDE